MRQRRRGPKQKQYSSFGKTGPVTGPDGYPVTFILTGPSDVPTNFGVEGIGDALIGLTLAAIAGAVLGLVHHARGAWAATIVVDRAGGPVLRRRFATAEPAVNALLDIADGVEERGLTALPQDWKPVRGLARMQAVRSCREE